LDCTLIFLTCRLSCTAKRVKALGSASLDPGVEMVLATSSPGSRRAGLQIHRGRYNQARRYSLSMAMTFWT